MLYWDCRRRLMILREFRALGLQYFTNIQARFLEPPIENDTARKARFEINRIMGAVDESFDKLRSARTYMYYPPPAVGGYAREVDFIANLFDLWQMQVNPQVIGDVIDRAVGDYERECERLFKAIFNPFYWLKILFVGFLRLPFALLGATGFNARKAESSLAGKVTKLLLFLATVIPAGFLVADRWPGIAALFHRVVERLHHWF